MGRRVRHINPAKCGATVVLDARRITGLNDGDAVSTWSDASGIGNHFFATGTGRPTYKVGIQGGLPVLRFDGADDFLNAYGVVVGTAEFACLVVSKATVHQVQFARLIEAGGYNIHSALTANQSFPSLSNDWYLEVVSSAGYGTGDVGSITGSHVIRSGRSGSNAVIHQDGAAIFSRASSAPGSGTHRVMIGQYIGGADYGWNGDIAAVYWFPSYSIPILRRFEQSLALTWRIPYG